MSEQDPREQVPPALPSEAITPPEVSEDLDTHQPEPSEPVVEPPPRLERRVNLDGLVWAIILIWTRVMLLADATGYLNAVGIRGFAPPWDLPLRPGVWTLVFLGVTVAVGLDVMVRLIVPRYRRNVLGYVILAVVSLSLGVGRLGLMWPSILVILGVALLLRRRG